MMNYFAPRSAAERYATGRPYYHPQVIQLIQNMLGLTAPVGRALDVGCGTGMSSIALRALARQVIGVDIASAMMAFAPPGPGVRYALSAAERLPFPAGRFDLVTISSAFHWLNQQQFLAEARRVLREGGVLVIYDNYFTAQMQENPAFEARFREAYLARYPSPSRKRAALSAAQAAEAGFALEYETAYENIVSFSLNGLLEYLVTQSNIIAAVEGGQESILEVRAWLRETLLPLWGDPAQNANFVFRGPICCLRRQP